MEEELIAQRDAAIAVTKELQRQLQQHREVVERTIERRALTAERLRFHAEEELRRVQEDREWETRMCDRMLYMSLFTGMIGALVGWLLGLVVFVLLGQPVFGFLLVLPAMAIGSLLGLVIAKTKIHLENRRRSAKRKRKTRHAEVEMAVHSSVHGTDEPLEPLQHMPGMDKVAEQTEMLLSSTAGEDMEAPSAGWLARGFHLVSYTWHTSIDIAQNLHPSKGYMQSIFSSSTGADSTKKDH